MDSLILIGLDLGTTVLKACAFADRTGTALVQASRRLPVSTGADGRREQRAHALLMALRGIFGELRRHLGRRWGKVAGIGLAAQGGSCVLCERTSGRAHSPVLLWNDLRFMPHLARVAALREAPYWHSLAWRNEPGWGLARILWLRERHPAWLRKGTIYAGVGDFLFFQLTGQWRQDAGNALQIGCYNVPRGQLDPAPLSLVGADLTFVSPLRPGHESAPLNARGCDLLGLPEGIPVVGPYMDHEAGYLSAAGSMNRGRLEASGPLQMSLGTAWVGNFVLPERTKWTSPFQLVLPAPTGSGWLVVQPLLTGNVTWDWGLQTLLHADHRTALQKLAQVFARDLLPPEGLTALPWFNMPNPLQAGVLGGGAFWGLNARTEPRDLLRALAVAMVHETRRVFRQVITSGRIDSVVLGGGAGKGAFFQKLLAAAFHPVPVQTLVEEDLGGVRGALYGLSSTITRAVVQPVKLPAPKIRAQLDRGFEAYNHLFDRLYAHVPAGGPVQLTT